jgi:uncharacterized protein YjbI with pentapeptide repeats
MVLLNLLVSVPALAQDRTIIGCAHDKQWKPSRAELERILSAHQDWTQNSDSASSSGGRVFTPSVGRADLCNADLSGAELAGFTLQKADLRGANLSRAKLKNANLEFAELNGADLTQADLREARLNQAKLSGADMRHTNLSRARLNNADLSKAQLNGANLRRAELRDAQLMEANLEDASLAQADLSNANLTESKLDRAYLAGAKLDRANLWLARLNHADLSEATLNGANLTNARLVDVDFWQAKLNGAKLTNSILRNASFVSAQLNNVDFSNSNLAGADLTGASVAGAMLSYSILSNAVYAPHSAPPDPVLTGILELETTKFGPGEENGLVQIRDLLQKAGLRDLERAATFAIEHGRTRHALAQWKHNPAAAAEGVFRTVAFDWTTAYGLRPSRTLLIITMLWAMMVPIYAWVIHCSRGCGSAIGNIYRIWPKERVELQSGIPAVESSSRAETLTSSGFALLGWSAYFSLLSTFHIGFREFSIGNWLTRIQPRIFSLEASGWTRTLSGAQSVLSVYLLAMWLLTYFGRPFQ